MIRCIPIALTIALLVCGCSPTEQIAPQLSEEDQIREAVFRYQFEFNQSGFGKAANAYFLSVEGNKDPSPQLLERFDRHRPPVKPVSASTLESGTAQVLDMETGLPGLIFVITEIRWLSDQEVAVDGGYEEASESGSGNTYSVVKQGGTWVVVGREMHWIK